MVGTGLITSASGLHPRWMNGSRGRDQSGPCLCSPILEAVLDDARQFLSANGTWAVDEESLLLEGTINQRRYIGLIIAKRTYPIHNTGVTHERHECERKYLCHLCRGQSTHVGS